MAYPEGTESQWLYFGLKSGGAVSLPLIMKSLEIKTRGGGFHRGVCMEPGGQKSGRGVHWSGDFVILEAGVFKSAPSTLVAVKEKSAIRDNRMSENKTQVRAARDPWLWPMPPV